MNLYELALLPAVRRIAKTLGQEFGLWVGLIGADGNQVKFPNSKEHPVCEFFMANSHEGGTCTSCVNSWATNNQPKVACHVGLDVLLVPFQSLAGEGRLYASGFLAAESAPERVDALRRFAPSIVDDAAIDSIEILDRRRRDVASLLLKSMADEIESLGQSAEVPEANFAGMLGASEPMLKLFRTLKKISRSNSTVLIQGENGTGKELIARAIHSNSPRRDRTFVAQNVAAISSELIESELFGHRRGAFSGAVRDREGLFEAAHHGTFFLDEIGELNQSLQVKFLRVLQEGTFLPVGGEEFRKVDVRVLCATNRDLKQAVDEHRFRQDLYYRINVIVVEAPALRHRRSDVSLLAKHFILAACHHHERPRKKLSPDAIRKLEAHPWPGNVRELENEMERLVIMTGDDPLIEASEIRFGSGTRSGTDNLAVADLKLPAAVEALERRMILEALRRTGWNKTKCAEELGVSRRNLIRKVATYELEKQR